MKILNERRQKEDLEITKRIAKNRGSSYRSFKTASENEEKEE